jgi:hypothetical protein
MTGMAEEYDFSKKEYFHINFYQWVSWVNSDLFCNSVPVIFNKIRSVNFNSKNEARLCMGRIEETT